MTIRQRWSLDPLLTPPHRPDGGNQNTTAFMAKQMMEISTSKTVSNTLGNYNSRTYQGKAWTQAEYEFENKRGELGRQYGVRDWSRANLNFEIVRKNGIAIAQPIDHSKPPLQERWQRRIDEGYKAIVNTKTGPKKKPIKKSEIKMIMFDLGGNRQRMHAIAFDRPVKLGKNGIGLNGDVQRTAAVEEWAKDCYNYMAKRFGAENIIDFVVHLDETNPHIHCIVVPLTRDGKLSYTELFGGSHAQAKARAEKDGTNPSFRKGISEYHKELHSDFARQVGDKWGLERGDDVKITGNTHKSTAESLKEKNVLEEEIKAAEEAAKEADEALSFKNKSLAKIGITPVRKKTDLEAENERLAAEKEEANKIAREEREKATAATKRADTAYNRGLTDGKQQEKDSLQTRIKAAKDEVRQDLPAEIRKMANFKAEEKDSPELIATHWRWSENERVKAKKQLQSITSQLSESNSLLKALLSIPIIKAAVEAIRWVFGYPHTLNYGMDAGKVNAISNALDLAEGVDGRKKLGKTLISLASEGFKPAETTLDKVEDEVNRVAEGTHKHLSEEQRSITLHR